MEKISSRIMLAGILFLISFTFYYCHLLPDVGFIDSPIFTGKAYHLNLGVSSLDHPLFMLLGRIFIISPLPFNGSPAFRMNLAAAFFGALSVAMLALNVHLYTRSKILASIISLSLMTSWNLFWSSTETEVYTLNAAFLLIILYGAAKFENTGRTRFLYFAVYTLGLSLTNHQAMIILIPAFILFMIKRKTAGNTLKKRDFVITLMLFLLGISIYPVLVMKMKFVNGMTFSKILWLASGGDFRGSFFSTFNPVDILYFSGKFIGYVLGNLDFFYTFLGILGFYLSFRSGKPFDLLLVIFFLLNGFIFINYNVPDRIFFYLPNILLLGLWAAPALKSILAWCIKKPVIQGVVLFMVTLSIGFKPFVYLWSCDLFRAKFEQLKEKRIDFFVPDIPERDDFKYYVFPGKNYITSSSWYERLMKNAPQGAVIVDDWYHGYAIMCDYYQGVLGLRKDLAFIRWFEIYGGTDLQKDDIEKQVVQVISDRGEILLSTTEYEISTLIERLNKKGSYSVSRRGLYFVVSHTF